VKRQAGFYPIPLGERTDPANLHGLAGGTGGTCVRLQAADKPEDLVQRLFAACAVPVLYPSKVSLPQGVSEALPSRLPPLRGDSPTLLAGKITPAATFDYILSGTVAGKEVTVKGSLKVPAPEAEHFFLVGVLAQWRRQGERPALIRADRALAFALEQSGVARADLLTKAQWAMEEKKFEAAVRVFEQARQVDPDLAEARGGAGFAPK